MYFELGGLHLGGTTGRLCGIAYTWAPTLISDFSIFNYCVRGATAMGDHWEKSCTCMYSELGDLHLGGITGRLRGCLGAHTYLEAFPFLMCFELGGCTYAGTLGEVLHFCVLT